MRFLPRRALAFVTVCLLVVTGCGGDANEINPRAVTSTGLDLTQLAPRAGFGIYDASNGKCALLDGDGLPEPVPVASAFKLWVLDAVARSVASGQIEWDTPVAVRDELRSDPSGEVYSYPTGQKVRVSKLAELMISISDNTATDLLIEFIGRDAISDVIREFAPDGASRTIPLLSTADMARLKFVHPDLGREYVGLDRDARRRFLKTLPERGPFPWPKDPTAVDRLDLTTPSFIYEIEWFASGADLCRTMADLARLAREEGLEPLNEILSANSGLPPGQTQAWTNTWFKGGSEPGVVTLVYRLATNKLDRVVAIALSDPDAPLAQKPQGQQIIESIIARAQP